MKKGNKKLNVSIIGSGFSSLSAACYLAKEGYNVSVFEKNPTLGGRARKMTDDLGLGFTFDMGPSWYWMPEVFDNFFADFDKETADYWDLIPLDPGFRMVFDTENKKYLDLDKDLNKVFELFQSLEAQAGGENGAQKLKDLLIDGKFTYNNAINNYMLSSGRNLAEYLNLDFIGGVLKGGLLKSYGKKIKSQFKNKELQKLLEFPVLFLGAKPEKIPYLYSLMAYTMIEHGTYYPMGGISSIVDGMVKLGDSLGVKYYVNSEIKHTEIENGKIKKLIIFDHQRVANKEKIANLTESTFELVPELNGKKLKKSKKVISNSVNTPATKNDIISQNLSAICPESNITDHYEIKTDWVVNGGDYYHFEQNILEEKYRKYSQKHWDKQVLSPSALICYIGLDVKLDQSKILHHTLFFDSDFNTHAASIYESKDWPAQKPLFYLCTPSKTDPNVAKKGNENLFLLMPLAPDCIDTPEMRDKFIDQMIDRVDLFLGGKESGKSIKKHIIYRKSYCVDDFKSDYFAYKGNAYGLANTLLQTGPLKPSIINPKIKNLFNCGQLTVPGPGIPPCIFSGKIAARELTNKN